MCNSIYSPNKMIIVRLRTSDINDQEIKNFLNNHIFLSDLLNRLIHRPHNRAIVNYLNY